MTDKKDLKKKYKQTLPRMGIFKIRNLANGKIFIGRGLNVQGIINSTKFQLAHGSHINSKLQKDYKDLGEQNFSFEVVDYLEPKEDPAYDYTPDLKALEELWLEKLEPFEEKGYNKRELSN